MNENYGLKPTAPTAELKEANDSELNNVLRRLSNYNLALKELTQALFSSVNKFGGEIRITVDPPKRPDGEQKVIPSFHAELDEMDATLTVFETLTKRLKEIV